MIFSFSYYPMEINKIKVLLQKLISESDTFGNSTPFNKSFGSDNLSEKVTMEAKAGLNALFC